MNTKLPTSLFVTLAIASLCYGQVNFEVDENKLNYEVLPLAIVADPETVKNLLQVFNKRSNFKIPETGIEYHIRIVTPDPNIDYKILKVDPKPNIDYKMRIINPRTRKESNKLSPFITDTISELLKKEVTPVEPKKSAEQEGS